MQLNEIEYANARPIDGYGPGFFRINGQACPAPLLVTADQVLEWAGLDDHAALTALAGQVDVLFLGMGADIAPIPADLRATLDDLGIGVEPMASAAACRTFNVLLSEGRRVAAALLPAG
jgi:uncharacterized protein